MRNALLLGLVLIVSITVGCNKRPSDSTESSSGGSGGSSSYLYVSSGGCYGGGVTASTTPSYTISRYNISSGALDKVIVDYNSFAPGDTPVAMADYSTTHLLVTIENTGGRRLELVPKDGSTGPTTYLINSTALSGVLRNMELLSDGSVLVSKSTAIEMFSSGKSRVTSGANPYISAPGSSCATSTTLLSDVKALSNGKILFTHAAATPNNKVGLIASTGYSTTADCLSVQAAPTTTALPTSLLVHSSGKVLVAYGSTTTASNLIYSYDLDATTNAWSNATSAYSTATVVNGPSAMTEDSSGNVYVANATSTFNTIEKFSFNSSTGVLTRSGTTPFVGASAFTKCISSMLVSN